MLPMCKLPGSGILQSVQCTLKRCAMFSVFSLLSFMCSVDSVCCVHPCSVQYAVCRVHPCSVQCAVRCVTSCSAQCVVYIFVVYSV